MPSTVRLSRDRLISAMRIHGDSDWIDLYDGYRSEPYEIRARLSSDEGKTWSPDIVLDKGATWEIGYTRTVQRADGKLVTVYYVSEEPEQGRVISATIWNP